MTTLKEYKAMMEGATDAPIGYADISSVKGWDKLRGTQYASNEKCYLPFSKVPFETEHSNCDTPIYLHADSIYPSLIRVIELAEDALEVSLSMSENECWPVEEIVIKQALSEIRKLRGE